MSNAYDIFLLKTGGEKQYLGQMPAKAISFNRYNEGLLVAAGKISNTNAEKSVFLHFSARFREKALLEFQSNEKAYEGDFSFINFDPETQIVVFGSVGPVKEKGIDATIISSANHQEAETATPTLM